jgi:hypothetical protein
MAATDMRADCFQSNHRKSTGFGSELLLVLRDAERPLSLGDLSQRLGRPYRAVAFTVSAACSSGHVDRLEGGLYSLRPRPALAELFAFVHGCEAMWELNDRLRVFARARRNDRDQGQT